MGSSGGSGSGGLGYFGGDELVVAVVVAGVISHGECVSVDGDAGWLCCWS